MACNDTDNSMNTSKVMMPNVIAKRFPILMLVKFIYSQFAIYLFANLNSAPTSIIIATRPSPIIVAPDTPGTLR
jgi:hypothetical protein